MSETDYKPVKRSAPGRLVRFGANPDLGQRRFLMIPHCVVDQLDAADLGVYLKVLRASRPFPSTASIIDTRTGEVLHEVPLGCREVFVSREQIGRWRNSADRANHGEAGRKCVRRLVALGLLTVRKTANAAKRGYSRHVLSLPMADVHLSGRSGTPAPSGDRVDTDPDATAEKLCIDRDDARPASTEAASAGYAMDGDDRDGASGTETVRAFADDRVDTGPDWISEVDRDALMKKNGRLCQWGVIQEAPCGVGRPDTPGEPPRGGSGLDSRPPMAQPEPARFVPRVAPARHGTPWTPEQRAILEANVEKVRRLSAVRREELPDVDVDEAA